MIFDYIRVLRPKQWVKNLLIFIPPTAGATLANHIEIVCLTFFVFCGSSSLGYVYNDWTDRKADSLNPKKKNRPFASGRLSLTSAFSISVALISLVSLLLIISKNFYLTLVTISYISTTFLYTKWFKHIAVVEVVVLSACFVIRSVAGAVAGDSPLSRWFFLVVTFGTVLIVSGKRLAEFLAGANSRSVLHAYSESYLRALMVLGASGSLFGFALWTFSVDSRITFAQMSFFPFMIFILRLFWVLDSGKSERSEDFPIQDRVVQVSVLMTFLLLLYVVYGT